MINLFEFASDDKSLVYIGTLFGNMSGIIPNIEGTSKDVTLISTMFGVFNSTILAVAALIVIYTTVMGVIFTAHEGDFMGKKWNNLWTPLRMVLGIACLVPFAGGYSIIQLVMMWVIVQGIGAADKLWTTAATYVFTTGNASAGINLPMTDIKQNMEGLFKGLICQQTAALAYPPLIEGAAGGYYCNGKSSQFCSNKGNTFDPGSTVYQLGPNGLCGTVTYCDQSTNGLCSDSGSLGCYTCKAQVAVLAQIIGVMTGVADQFANIDYKYQQFYVSTPDKPVDAPDWLQTYCTQNNIDCKPASLPTPTVGASSPSDSVVQNLYWPSALKPALGDPSFLITLMTQYRESLTTAISEFAGGGSTSLTGQFANAINTGWILAGSYYYVIAQGNSNQLSQAMPTLSVNLSDPSQNELKDYRNNYSAALALVTAVNAGGNGISTASQATGGATDNANMGANDAYNIVSSAANATGVDPIAQMQQAGTAMLVVVQALFLYLMVSALALGLLGYISPFVLGTGVDNPVGGATSLVYMILVPALLFFMGLMTVYGGLLSIYLPLIPYLIFTVGAIGWLIATIEAMVAGPLVALGILTPSEHHGLLGHGERALFFIFNVFLRPSLMIFGLMAGMLLARVVINMINYAFWGVVADGIAGAGSSTGEGSRYYFILNPLAFILFLGAYIFLLVTAVNKCFAAIYLIPSQVTTWIGHHAGGPGMGEEAAAGELKSTVGAGTTGAKGIQSSAPQATGKYAAGEEKRLGAKAAATRAGGESEIEKGGGGGGTGTPPAAGGGGGGGNAGNPPAAGGGGGNNPPAGGGGAQGGNNPPPPR